MNPQDVNLRRHETRVDKYEKYFNEARGLSIGGDGWPIVGVEQEFGIIQMMCFHKLKEIMFLKFRFKGTKSQLIGRSIMVVRD
ncbi:MAG TPA: hypothetical protein VF691_06165 [Cytophagaceae bacterium]|jgi:hypothetical protein